MISHNAFFEIVHEFEMVSIEMLILPMKQSVSTEVNSVQEEEDV